MFYYRVNDLQVTAVGGGANFNRLLNADKAIGYGFEFNAEAEPIDRLLLTAGLSYNNTEIDDPNLFTQPCGGGCTVLDRPRRSRARCASTATACRTRRSGSPT